MDAKAVIPAVRSTHAHSAPKPLSPRLRAAIHHMVYEGKDYVAAAKAAGISPARMRQAMGTATVQAYHAQQAKVHRTSLTGRATARLVELSEQDRQLMAALGATKALLEPPADPAQRGVSLAAAGLVIVVGAQPQPQVIDAVPVSNNPAENDT